MRAGSTQTVKAFDSLKDKKISSKQGFISELRNKQKPVNIFNTLKNEQKTPPAKSIEQLNLPVEEKTRKSFAALKDKGVTDRPLKAENKAINNTYKALANRRVSTRQEGEKILRAGDATEKNFKILQDRPVASKELMLMRLRSLTKATFEGLEGKPVVQKNFAQVLKERTDLSVKSSEMLSGNTIKVNNLKALQARLDKINYPQNLSVYNHRIFITQEDLENKRRKKIETGSIAEQMMAWDKNINVATKPAQVNPDSSLQLIRLCQMCQTKVGVDIVLCPACALIRKQFYETKLKLVYQTGAKRDYFATKSPAMEEGNVAKKFDRIELSFDAANIFSKTGVGEMASLRKGQAFPKMRDVLAVSKGHSMYASKQFA